MVVKLMLGSNYQVSDIIDKLLIRHPQVSMTQVADTYHWPVPVERGKSGQSVLAQP
jgi:hypothetical protein